MSMGIATLKLAHTRSHARARAAQAYKLVLLSSVSYNTLEFTRSSLEWMAEGAWAPSTVAFA